VPQQFTYDTSSSELDPAFLEAVERFERGDMEAAARLLEKALKGVNKLDRHYGKYLSYYGAALALSGDPRGLEHCRAAAQAERNDGDILYHLARAEVRFRNRRRAIAAIEAGLKVEGSHERLTSLRASLGVRRLPVLSFLSRDNVLNKILGKLTYRGPRGKRPKSR
jgi:tetratricopeptide (TPR) repeat protein